MPSTPDNPAYIQRESQLRGVTADLQAATARRAELLARYEDLERRLQVTPEVEREYNARSRGLAQLVAQYNDTQAKINDAQIALNLEEDPTSERFTILEQPSMSNSPASPNRFAVLVLTLAIALALGAGVVATAERSDQTVRNVQDVIANLEMPPLVAIPYVETRRDLKQRSRRRLLGAGAVAAWVGVIYLLVVTPV